MHNNFHNLLKRNFFLLAVALLFQHGSNGEIEDLNDSNVDRGMGRIDYQFQNLKIKIEEKIDVQIISRSTDHEPKLHGELGVNLPLEIGDPDVEINKENIKLNWGSKLILQIRKAETAQCHTVLWESYLDSSLEDCFPYGRANWFGGPEIIHQVWPIEKLVLEEVPYVTQMFGNIAKAEPYWLNSKGAYIYVSPGTPLFVDSNNHRTDTICFIANDVAPYLKREKRVLEYNLCGFNDPREAQEHAIATFIGKPSGLPDIRMIEHPVWSTWVRYRFVVNETSVLQFANDIVRHGFSNSQIEIDDNWEACYGSTKFNTSRFPDLKELIKKLKNLGFRITIWVHPFVNEDCPTYSHLKNQGYFVANSAGNSTMIWWDGKGSSIDFTKPKAVQWFREMHWKTLKDNGIDGLKFDAGETSWLPQIPVLNCSVDDHPKAYTAAYVDTVSQFGPLTEVRVTHHTQHYPVFVRMVDKDSKWTLNNGLPTVITTMLVMNIQGYPWVLPDMVGGNSYAPDVVDKEMFIRWLQTNTFMPCIQFSVAPWDFDYETIAISKKFTELHYKYSSKIIQLMKNTVQTGAPLNPPIWWVDPKNPIAHKIYSEFLLGEDILVAPILAKGTTRRDIYLPKGYWRDENNPSKIYKGRRWLRNYYADLSTLPYFTRVKHSNTNYFSNEDSVNNLQVFDDISKIIPEI
ncbi:myogenesis-regulating glycosidase-like [Lycorma delicatula]|uniref:myogenesis-regulating glycosidase-like n=1 Tax=Lycorma delicatula TaxID=130591 RepID=UPI003F51A0AF